jgi:hypothetical protein
MNPTIFTVEQENLLCVFNTSTRADCIEDITFSMQHFDEPEMLELAESTLAILQTMTDEDFSAHSFHPAYHNDDDETEV